MRQSVSVLLTLRSWILDGTLCAGERLWEASLADRLSVSRTPLREALSRLAHEGLLERADRGGYAVRSFSPEYLKQTIELRGTLEGLAARQAAEARPSATRLEPLRQLVDRIDALVTHPVLDEDALSQYTTLNSAFHQHLIALADNMALAEALARIEHLPFASPSAFVMSYAHSPSAHRSLLIANDQHRCLVDAITHGEGARAEQIAREHARLAQRNLDTVLEHPARLERLRGSALIQAP
ncbi:GntR family transcriptional regulator [Larsenimonas suaedae]|uniref:GntR family transcriptional regulator n=1 Tax=Larsenimonas suaedae TaxID=1851019 RepID=A0ABU1GVQ9_9GAMM|nr:GntR family transcriptional regulator [Larsenimonas suaedae]MCM2973245.1 GntR family transcriptional regulator [Larsenimonas suaedae]MDR5896138.1 GntR family transcriptional regulator [Larsenimonas suaedae]